MYSFISTVLQFIYLFIRQIAIWSLFLILPFIALINFYLISKSKTKLRHFFHIWGRLTSKIAGIKIQVEGINQLNPNKNYIFIGNHSSIADAAIFLGYINYDVVWMGKKEIFNIPIMDIGSGSVAFRKGALSQLDLRAKGFGIHAELFVKAARRGYIISEIPSKSGYTSTGSFHIWKHSLPILSETIALWLGRL